ncbi:YukJ family protein [Granulicella arctica]|uniref:Uncharacterized protein YukJ n=1 Tax=Granulicella arctica TaxID=940613 RepID=A0A7Y9PF43_9BACT|nr:YukJ family protein [Granulicella arctica]NYF78772.1 uncharacterized protein YukJ [Granulicella arctica]
MPIINYSVLQGTPTAGKVVTGSSTHYQITMQATGGPFTVAVNIQSTDGSEVLYAILDNFQPPDPTALLALSSGMTPLPSQPGGLALDFVRSQVAGQPMITLAQMTLLPKNLALTDRADPALNAIDTLLNQAIAAGNATIYAFGSAYADSGKVDGIHDIHMNQGNPLNSYGADNGIWQDGTLFLYLPTPNTWTAVFIAFQTESWTTDDNGNPT